MNAKQERKRYVVDVPEADPMPQLACVGQVTEIPDGKVSSTGTGSFYQPVKIQGMHGSPDAPFLGIVYFPEWLKPGFSTRVFKEFNEKDEYSLKFQYKKNIKANKEKGKKNVPSTLEGLTNTPEQFQQLFDMIHEETDGVEEIRPEMMTRALRNYFREHQGEPVGYVLSQKSDPVKDEDGNKIKGADGKNLYERTDSYQITSWFNPLDTRSMDRLLERADKSAMEAGSERKATFRVTFDPEVPF